MEVGHTIIADNMQTSKTPPKSCLVVLHHPPPQFLKTGKKVLLYKSTCIPHLFSELQKGFFFSENFDLLKIFLSCCQLVYILKLV